MTDDIAAVRVVGMVAGGRQAVVAHVTNDDPVLLIPEPDNPADENAVAVWVAPRHWIAHPDALRSSIRDDAGRGSVHPDDRSAFRQAGYLPATVAADLALPGEVVGVVWRIRHSPETTYDVFGQVHQRVAGFDVCARLPQRRERVSP